MNTEIEGEREVDRAKGVLKPPVVTSEERVLLAWLQSQMANERTFLAWCRTSISLLAFGFVIQRFEIFLSHLVQLMKLQGIAGAFTPSAAITYLSLFSFILAGIAAAVGVRFLMVRRHIAKGEAVFSIAPDILVVLPVMVLVAIAIFLALPRLFELGEKLM